MSKPSALAILVIAPAALMLMLWWVAPAGAQVPGLISGAGLVWTKHAGPDGDCSISDVSFTGDSGVVLCDNEPGSNANNVHAVASNWPPESGGMVFDVFFEYVGTRTGAMVTLFHRVSGVPRTIAQVMIGQSVSLRVCLFDDVGNAPADCDYIDDYPANYFGGSSGGVTLGITAASHDAGGRATITNVMIWTADGPTPTPPPGYEPIGDVDPGDYGGTCVYTNTQGIPTLTSANILLNPSFETFNYTSMPSGWEHWSPGTVFPVFARSVKAARSGDWGMSAAPDSSFGILSGICRSFNIDSGVESIAVGQYARSVESGGSSGSSVDLRIYPGYYPNVQWDNPTSVISQTFGTELSEWTALAGSYQVSGPASLTICSVGVGHTTVHVDDFWVYESSETDEFALICPEVGGEPIPDPPPLPGTDFGDDVPAPAPTAFGVCYDCIRPLTILEIGSWIKWLVCMLGNLFRCELYHWLLASINWIRGVWLWLVGLVEWLPEAGQVVLSWVGNAINEALGFVGAVWDRFRMSFVTFLQNLVQAVLNTKFIQDAWIFVTWLQRALEYVQALLSTFVGMLRSLYMAAVDIAELVRSIIVSVIEAWQAPPDPDVFSFLPGGGGAMMPESTEGISSDKISWLVLVAIASFDAIFGSFGLQYLQFVVFGVVGFGVIAWTLKQFQDIVPI